jgi:WD40 repeat protein
MFELDSNVLHLYDIAANTDTTITIPGFSSVIKYCTHPGMAELLVVANQKAVYSIHLKGGSTSCYTESSCVHGIRFDPLNSMNCLVVQDSPTWVVLTFVPEYRIIAKSIREGISCCCGDWIQTMPGRIITGDSKRGILYYWAAASGDIIERVNVHDYGIVTMTRISPSAFALTFLDGMLGVYDVSERRLTKEINNAHTNTIFSCTFLPTDASVLATAGADGLVCFWSVPELRPIDKFTPSAKSRMLDLCFSPGGGYAAFGTTRGELIVYSMKTKAIIVQERLHKGSIVGIAWSPHDLSMIATASSDSKSCMYDIEKKKAIAVITLRAKLKRVRWSPKSRTVAIGCEDGSLYVRSEGGAYQVIPGTSSPLFDVAYNPFNETQVASVNDAGDILLFNTSSSSVEVWPGHSGPGRAVLWSPIIENVLFSGGYDGKLIMWNVPTKTKLTSIAAHPNHIYSLAIHPDHPMLLASVSRDETVRLWSVDRYLPKQKIQAVLSGDKFAIEKYCPFEGSSSLAKLLHRVLRDGIRCSFSGDDVCHVNDIVKVTRQRITKLTGAVPRDAQALSRAPAARQSLIDAADLSLKSGDVKRYCELLFIAGEHEKAVAAAPAVSFNFWQELIAMRSDMLKGSEQSAELALVAGQTDVAIDRLTALKEFDSVSLIVAALRGPAFAPRTKGRRLENQTEPRPYTQGTFDDPTDLTAYRIASRHARELIEHGAPLRAAATLLATGDVASSAWILLHCGELSWAKVVASCMEMRSAIDNAFTDFCAYHGLADLITDKLSRSQQTELIPAIQFESFSARDRYYKKHGFGTMESYKHEASHTRGVKQIYNLILAGKEAEAQEVAVALVKPLIQSASWNFAEVAEIVDILRNVRNPIPQFVAVSLVCGIYRAMWRGYHQIVKSLLQKLLECQIEWVSREVKTLQIAVALGLAQHNPEAGRAYASKLENRDCEAFKALQGVTEGVDGGSRVRAQIAGINPVNPDCAQRVSICSGAGFDGNAFILEDGTTAVSADEALMWFEVTPFSPLKTHRRLCPY